MSIFGLKDKSWLNLFGEYAKCFPLEWKKLEEILESKTFLPNREKVFRCFSYFSLIETKIVILGQDPYPNKDDACGLAFSVERKTKLPKSLKNMFDELERDLGIVKKDGDLEAWAKQGVLLINSMLTFDLELKKGNKEWKKFTDFILSNLPDEVLFVCMGTNAHTVCSGKKNKIFTSHPSPLGFKKSGANFIPFYNSHIFSKINTYLKSINKDEISW